MKNIDYTKKMLKIAVIGALAVTTLPMASFAKLPMPPGYESKKESSESQRKEERRESRSSSSPDRGSSGGGRSEERRAPKKERRKGKPRGSGVHVETPALFDTASGGSGSSESSGSTASESAISSESSAADNYSPLHDDDKSVLNEERIEICRKYPYTLVGCLKEGYFTVKSVDSKGNTPLMYAVLAGNEQGVDFLLEWGADVKTVNAQGKTPLMLAVSTGNKHIIEALRKAGA